MEIQNQVEQYFLGIKPTRSSWWKEKIFSAVQSYNRKKKIKSDIEMQEIIKSIHSKEDKKLFDQAAIKAISKDKILKNDKRNYNENIKDIRQELLIRFHKSYNSERANEEQFLYGNISANLVKDFKKKNYRYEIEKSNPTVNDEEYNVQMIKKPLFQPLNDQFYEKGEEELDENSKDDELSQNYLKKLIGQMETNPDASRGFYSIYKHLAITQPKLIKERKFPDLVHSYPSKEFIYKQYEYLKDVDDVRINVPGYLKHYGIVHANHRYFMLKSIEALHVCRKRFEEHFLPKLIKIGKLEDDLRNNVPLLSSVIVSKENEIINTAYKGEGDCLDDHCEFILFKKVLETDSEKHNIIGGTLYVTLEPCNKRGYFIDANGRKRPKIPCAVRCVESGIKKIFIGTFDPNKRVEWQGVNILETGLYPFPCKDGIIKGSDDEETLALNLLRDEFEYNRYEIVEKNSNTLKYRIGKPVEVSFFHPDLSIEIMELNKEFIGNYSEDAFPYSKLMK